MGGTVGGRGRLGRGFDRLIELVPRGVELSGLRGLVEDDLVDDEALAAVLGPEAVGFVGRSDIPRIRPILVALAARAVGAREVDQEAQHAAELLHMGLRVHDLALGREGGKRRRVARRIAKSVGWLTGNHLTVRALELSRHSAPGVLEELLDALRAFSDAQALSRELVGAVPSYDDWLDHADAHTGALFTFCCRSGGHLAGAGTRELLALGRYGRHFGRMWHIAEDVSILDHGEPALHLLARAQAGRPVLPVVYACESAEDVGIVWQRLVSDGDPDDARTLARHLRALGVPRSRESIVTESWRARRALRALPDTTYRQGLDRLAGEVVRAGRPEGKRPPLLPTE